MKRVRIDDAERRRFAVRPGDILVNRVNALSHLGKSTLIVEMDEPTVFESNMMKLSLTPTIEPVFLFAWLSSPDAREQIRSKAKKAINQASVNQSDIAALQVPVVPLEQQKDYAVFYGEMMIKREADHYRIARADELFASLQHRAFRGEL